MPRPNGGTILYRLPDRGVDDAMVKRALTGLATRFDRPVAHVDQAVTNASRLARIAGTWNVKREAPGRSRRMVTADCELADAPAPISLDALAALLHAAHETRLKPLSAARTRGGGPSAPIPEGRRNTSLMALAGFLRRDGWEHEGIQTALTAINGTCCKPALPESELSGIAGRAAGYEAPERAEVLEPVFIRMEDVGVLMQNLASLVYGGRLRIAAQLAEAPQLLRELGDLEVRVTAAGREQYGVSADAVGHHADLVSALSLACWWLCRPPRRRVGWVANPFRQGAV